MSAARILPWPREGTGAASLESAQLALLAGLQHTPELRPNFSVVHKRRPSRLDCSA
jgi:hypothetical protein